MKFGRISGRNNNSEAFPKTKNFHRKISPQITQDEKAEKDFLTEIFKKP
jgi:hypothetical protein